jgi:hypothetical protein
MSIGLYIALFLAGAIVDAVWLALRFPNAGPKSLTSAGVAFFSGGAVMTVLAPLIAAAGSGGFVTAFAVGFLGFVYFFLTGLWFVRVMVGSLSGFIR